MALKELGTPSSMPALPETPNLSFLEVSRREVEVVLDIVKRKEEIAVKNAGQMAVTVRAVCCLHIGISQI
jgi:hypothetical protein